MVSGWKPKESARKILHGMRRMKLGIYFSSCLSARLLQVGYLPLLKVPSPVR